MAVTTATYTATLQSFPLQQNVNGINFARGKITLFSPSTSTVSRLYMCKLPHGAVVVDGYANWKGAAVGTLAMGIADTGSDKTLSTVLIAAATVSASAFARVTGVGVLPAPISLTSADTLQYKWLMVVHNNPTTSGSVCCVADVLVLYTMDQSIRSENLKNVG